MSRHLLSLTMIIIFCITTSGYSQECANQNNIYSFFYNGFEYEIVKENQTWVNAAACAVERGGILCEVDSQEEQDTIFYHLNNAGINVANTVAPDGGGASYVWIGGNDLAIEGDWIWDGDNDGIGPQFWEGDWNGTPVGGLYNNWGGEPDNWNNQDGLGLALTNWPYGSPGQWNDVDDGNTLYYVIEYGDDVGFQEPLSPESLIRIYPVPADEYFIVKFESNNKTIDKMEIINSMGLIVNSFHSVANGSSIDVHRFSSGIYYVQFLFSDGENVIKKILIR